MKVEPFSFLTALFITILILYIFSPNPEIMIKYPDLSQEVSDVYIDNKGVCYRYHRVEVEDDNKFSISKTN